MVGSTAGMANRLDRPRPPTHILVGSGIAQTFVPSTYRMLAESTLGDGDYWSSAKLVPVLRPFLVNG